MSSYPTGAVLLVVALVFGVVLPDPWGLAIGTPLAFLAAILVVTVVRRSTDLAVLWLVAGAAALPAAGGPLVAHDMVLRIVGSEEVCTVRSLTVVEGGSGRGRRGDVYRRTVECPDGPLIFDAAPSAIDRSRDAVGVLADPTGLVVPRPVDLLLPAWTAAIPAVGYVVLGIVAAATRRRRPTPR